MTQPAFPATQQRFELDFYVQGSAWQGAYDRLEVWRSRVTADGPYEALTADTWAPAVLPVGFVGAPPNPSVTGPSVFLVGKTLTFELNEETVISVTFTGSDPLTMEQAATQINAAATGLLFSYVASNGQLVVRSTQLGVAVVLNCTGVDAAPVLGFATSEPGSVAFGQDARLVLVPGQVQYGFVDPNGSSSYFYKTRFYSSVSQLTSDYSLPFQGPVGQGLSPTSTVLCYVDLVDQNGAPAANREVLIYNEFNGQLLEGRAVVGGTLKLLTDYNGHAEVLLARGSMVTVAFAGTSLARKITIPTDQTITSVNLLDPTLGCDDLFTVQLPSIPFAVRRSL